MSTPYGEWPSPVDPADVAAGGRDFGGVRIDGEHAYWLERRPTEGGRGVLRRAPLDRARAGSGAPAHRDEPPRYDELPVREDLTPEGFDVRTLVHQYGGGDFAVADGTLVVASMDDQRLYRLPADGDAGPTPITPDPPEPLALRYADVTVDPDARVAYAVRERHVGPGTDDEPENEVVRIPLFPAEEGDEGDDGGDEGDDGGDEGDDGGDAKAVPDPAVIAAGRDFYAAPRPSPDGDRLAYLRWDHPNMPWDGTELVVVDLGGDGKPVEGSRRVVAGGPEESVCSPAWSPEGGLHAVSDRTGWWNLYRVGEHDDADTEGSDGDGATLRNLHPADAEFGAPMWRLGLSTYAFLDDGRIATLYTADGEPSLRLLDPATGDLEDPGLPYTAFRPASIRSDGERVAFVGHRSDAPSAVVAWSPGSGTDGEPDPSPAGGDGAHHLRESTDDPIDPAYVSTPEPIVFPTGDAVGADGTVAYAHYYPPHNPDVRPPDDPARPPVVVTVHGGPTSRSAVSLSASTQFFTTRGIAVLDVNYRGSTGYGRAYRDALDGQWGVRDTLDCVNAARHAVAEGLADPDRLAISGGSAGGYAVLCALAFHDTFDAGASYYGVADLAALSAETHKFESRYLDGLVGPLPGTEATYRERSPLYHAEGISAPLLLLQGGEDEVVPPAQAEAMIDALVAGGTPYAYVEFPEERHGFRDADNIARAHAAELAFYGEALGFEPDHDADGVRLLVGEYPPEFE